MTQREAKDRQRLQVFVDPEVARLIRVLAATRSCSHGDIVAQAVRDLNARTGPIIPTKRGARQLLNRMIEAKL